LIDLFLFLVGQAGKNSLSGIFLPVRVKYRIKIEWRSGSSHYRSWEKPPAVVFMFMGVVLGEAPLALGAEAALEPHRYP
jgi:hypothetical protein